MLGGRSLSLRILPMSESLRVALDTLYFVGKLYDGAGSYPQTIDGHMDFLADICAMHETG